MRLVVSLTTLPSRYQNLRQTVEQLRRQTRPPDLIYLALPKICARLQQAYPPLPIEIAKYVTVVEPAVDYGPLTKIYGGLAMETDPDTLIVTLDDDMHYAPDLLEQFSQAAQEHPKAALCATGVLLAKPRYFSAIYTSLEPWVGYNHLLFPPFTEGVSREVDLVFGMGGVLYRRGFFPSLAECEKELFSLALNSRALFLSDDVLLSAYLNQRKIPRRVVKGLPPVRDQVHTEQDGLSVQLFKMLRTFNTALDELEAKGWLASRAPLTITETPAWWLIWLILGMLLLGGALVLLYLYIL